MEGFRKCNGKEHLFWPPQHTGVVMSAACNTAVLTKTVHTGVQTPVRSTFQHNDRHSPGENNNNYATATLLLLIK